MSPFYLRTILTLSGLVALGRAAPAGTGPNALGPNGGDNVSNSDVVYCGPEKGGIVNTEGEAENGPGIWITNQDTATEYYYIYENLRDTKPWKQVHIPKGQRRFVQVCGTFQGRAVRGTPAVNGDGRKHMLGTWFEFNVDGAGVMWGDVSFLEGSDGGGKVANPRSDTRGCFADDLLTGAPADALAPKGTGTRALARTAAGKAPAADRWERSRCRDDQVYLYGGPNPVIDSHTGRLEFTAYKGKA